MRVDVFCRLEETEQEVFLENELDRLGDTAFLIKFQEDRLQELQEREPEEFEKDENRVLAEEIQAKLAKAKEAHSRVQEILPQLGARKFIRVTLHKISFLDKGHYYNLLEEGIRWFKETYGIAITEDLGKDAYLRAVRNLVYYRAEILCSIDRVHKGRDVSYLMAEARIPYGTNPEDWKGWKSVNMPTGWTTLATNDIPEHLLSALMELNRELNAGSVESMPDFDFLSSRRPRSVLRV